MTEKEKETKNIRGIGNWRFCLYNPPSNQLIGPFQGELETSKEFHIITDSEGICLIAVPSPNIAYVINER
jgi:hypothetical protein